MAKSWVTDLFGDILKLKEHLKKDHNDESCLERINHFNNKYYPNVAKSACKLPKCRTRGDKKKRVKKYHLRIFRKRKSRYHSPDNNVNSKKCIQSIKHLISLIDKSKVERMYYTYQQGKVI